MKLLTKTLIACGAGVLIAIVGDLAFNSTALAVLGLLICGGAIGYCIAHPTKITEGK